MRRLDHIALVTPALEPVLERLAALKASFGPVEEFPGEGTREVYVGAAGQAARLLLLQPLGPEGPYARALARRGPGLHHVALPVRDLEAWLTDTGGWLLHPHSARSIHDCRTAWLSRKGVGTLLEVTEGDAPSGAPLVETLAVAARAPQADLLLTLGCTASADPHTWLTLGGRRWNAADLAACS